MKTCAIVVAAGNGERMGGSTPKQYIKICDATILEHTIAALEKSELIDSIVVVINPEHLDFYKNITSNKDIYFIAGGKSRQESVKNALNFLKLKTPKNVIVHDAARPFVSLLEIDSVIRGLESHEVVELVAKCYDTVDYDGEILSREKLNFALTPQAFRFQTLCKLHEKYEGHKNTDDISLARKEGIEIATIVGSKLNFKITTTEDLNLSGVIMNQNYIIRTGFGYDVHQIELMKDSHVFLGGVKIKSDCKIIAHSDGDVVIHAIVDAILGSMSLGDIGHYFPPSEDEWKGASSSIFLKKCTELLKKNSAHINNIDVSIVAEAPKIKPHIDEMKLKLAEILEISQNQIGIKATTSEKLGFIGRREGVAAHAVATIRVKQVQ